MKQLSFAIAALSCALLAANAAQAQQQSVIPGGSHLNPPLPTPPPPPSMAVPPVPKLDAPPSQPRARASGRPSFSDRISRCLDEGAAAGLDSVARSAYSRACANRD
jgi:hypothetical protein